MTRRKEPEDGQRADRRPPRLVRVAAGVEIVCSTDSHSVRGLANMPLAVAVARRGWATAARVVNTRPLLSILTG